MAKTIRASKTRIKKFKIMTEEQEREFRIKMFKTNEISVNDFHIGTFANFQKIKTKDIPNREPDFASRSGSKYWYDSDSVIRQSNHWGRTIASCNWLLNSCAYKGLSQGICKLGDFKRERTDLLKNAEGKEFLIGKTSLQRNAGGCMSVEELKGKFIKQTDSFYVFDNFKVGTQTLAYVKEINNNTQNKIKMKQGSEISEEQKMQFGRGYKDYEFKKMRIETDKLKLTERHSIAENPNLINDIKKNGIKEPVVVEYDEESDFYRVKNGNHRAAIAKELGIKSVEAILAEYKYEQGGNLNNTNKKENKMENCIGKTGLITDKKSLFKGQNCTVVKEQKRWYVCEVEENGKPKNVYVSRGGIEFDGAEMAKGGNVDGNAAEKTWNEMNFGARLLFMEDNFPERKFDTNEVVKKHLEKIKYKNLSEKYKKVVDEKFGNKMAKGGEINNYKEVGRFEKVEKIKIGDYVTLNDNQLGGFKVRHIKKTGNMITVLSEDKKELIKRNIGGLMYVHLPKNNSKTKAKLLIINSANPLSKQLIAEGFEQFNAIDYTEVKHANFNVLTHNESKKTFVVYPERIYAQLNEDALQSDVDYLKGKGIELVESFEQGGNIDSEQKLVYERWSKASGGDGTTGTIRTVPQNYYVATVHENNKITFDELDANTKNINTKQVEKLWNENKIPRKPSIYWDNKGEFVSEGKDKNGNTAIVYYNNESKKYYFTVNGRDLYNVEFETKDAAIKHLIGKGFEMQFYSDKRSVLQIEREIKELENEMEKNKNDYEAAVARIEKIKGEKLVELSEIKSVSSEGAKPQQGWLVGLNEEQIEFLCGLINRYGTVSEHPKATKENLGSFKYEYLKNLISNVNQNEIEEGGMSVLNGLKTHFNI